MATSNDHSRQVRCDWCDEWTDASSTYTVPWANVEFCERPCRERWTNAQVGHP